jgi:hypothetical protein
MRASEGPEEAQRELSEGQMETPREEEEGKT